MFSDLFAIKSRKNNYGNANLEHYRMFFFQHKKTCFYFFTGHVLINQLKAVDGFTKIILITYMTKTIRIPSTPMD